MGLITFFLLGGFSLLYMGKAMPNKPPFMEKAISWISENIDTIAPMALIYGLIATVLTPIMIYGATDMLIRLLANILIVAMALPYSFEKVAEKFQGKINDAILSETRNFIGWIGNQEKLVGIAGTVVTVLLFAILFR